MEPTFWTEKIEQAFPAMNRDTETEVLIVGGGLAGLMCAEALYKNGVKDICVADAGKIGGGDTARSSAMVSFAHDLVYRRMIKKHGEKLAREYLRLNREGAGKIRSIVDEYGVGCDFTDCDMVLYATTRKGAQAVEKERDAYQQLGAAVAAAENTELPFPVTAAIKIENQAYLNPYLFVSGLCGALAKRGVRFFEHTPVDGQPDGNKLKIGGHTVTAKHFIWATHYPFLNFPGFYFLKMYQSRSFNVVYESASPMRDMYEAAEDRGFEYRPAGNGHILCGGAAVRTGKYKRKSRFEIVEQNLSENCGVSAGNIRARFSAQDCMTFDFLPFAGRYSGFLDNVYVVTGFNKWGFTNAAACAKIIAALIRGGAADAAGVSSSALTNPFDPARLYTLKSPLKAACNIGTIAAGWMDSIFTPDAKSIGRIQPGDGAIVKHKGKRYGVYKDEHHQTHTIDAVCPHLGCGLKWNRDDRSWDCPCHGSRFDTDGKILNNPTVEKAAEADW